MMWTFKNIYENRKWKTFKNDDDEPTNDKTEPSYDACNDCNP